MVPNLVTYWKLALFMTLMDEGKCIKAGKNGFTYFAFYPYFLKPTVTFKLTNRIYFNFSSKKEKGLITCRNDTNALCIMSLFKLKKLLRECVFRPILYCKSDHHFLVLSNIPSKKLKLP